MVPFTLLPGFSQIVALEREIALASEPQKAALLNRYAHHLNVTLHTWDQQHLTAKIDQLALRCTRRFPHSSVLQETVVAFYTEIGQAEKAARFLPGGVTLRYDSGIRNRIPRMADKRPLLVWGAIALCVALVTGKMVTLRSMEPRCMPSTQGAPVKQPTLPGNEALHQAAIAYHQRADYRGAVARADSALADYRSRGDIAGTASALIQKGEALNALADFGGARLCLQEALTIRTRLGQKLAVAALQEDLSDLCTLMGDYTQANALLRECRATRAIAQEWTGVAQAQRGLGAVAAAVRRYPEALAFYRDSMQFAVQQHNAPLAADLKLRMAAVYRDTGHYAAATACAEESLRFWSAQSPQNPRWLAVCEQTLGSIAFSRGATRQAEEHLHRSDTLLAGLHANYTQARTWIWLARVLEARHAFEESRRLTAAARALVPLSPALLERD